jgi:enoyl-CoA hydratase/carnithine racemase
MDDDSILYEVSGKIATITMNRPDRLNALDTPAWEQLRDALLRADRDDDIRVVILSGAGKAFCSGDDIGDFEFDTSADAREYAKHIMRCGLTIERIETPVVAKVDGLAHGGGCEVAVIPDVTIIADDVTLRLPESRVGVVPGIATVRFPELIGLKQARELMLTNREIPAAEAKEIGLVNEVVAPDEIDDVVGKRANQIAKSAPIPTRLIKRNVNARLSDEAAAVNALNLVFMTEDVIEGMDAFFSERDPQWVDN